MAIGEVFTMRNTRKDQKPMKSGRMVNGVQVIARAVDILWALSRYPEGATLTQLTRDVSLPPSTVHRILNALEAARLVAFTTSAGYLQLGLGLAVLAELVPRNLGNELRPYLERLSSEVNEGVALGVLQKDKIFFIDHIEAPNPLRAFSAIGLAFPLHCTANGKAVLAQLPFEEVERLIPAQLETLTPNTITRRSRLLKELDLIRSERVAFDREEYTLGICAVGAAFRDPLGKFATISITIPSVRFYGNEQKLASALLKHIDFIQRDWASSQTLLHSKEQGQINKQGA
jgi:DNA-binding IclR family transcriptional regulator